MAKRKFILVVGADNASDVADPWLFEDAMPFLALRNPETDPDEVADAGTFEMPGVFPGGLQEDPDGELIVPGTEFQTIDITGKALDNIHTLTRFNSAVGGLDFVLASGGQPTDITAVVSQTQLTISVPQTYLPRSEPLVTCVGNVFAFAIGGLAPGDQVVFYVGALGVVGGNTLDFGHIYYIKTVEAALSTYTISATHSGPTFVSPDMGAIGPDTYAVVYDAPTLRPFARENTGADIYAYVDKFQDLRLLDPAITFNETFVLGERFFLGALVVSGVALGQPIDRVLVLGGDLGGLYPVVDGIAATLRIDHSYAAVVHFEELPPTVDQQPVTIVATNGALPTEIVPGTTYYLTSKVADAEREFSFLSVGGKFKTLDGLPHGLLNGEMFEITAVRDNAISFIDYLETGERYYVLFDPLVDTDDVFHLAASPDGGPAVLSSGPLDEPMTIRTLRHMAHYLSATLGGLPLTLGTTVPDPDLRIDVTTGDIVRGMLSGQRIEFFGGNSNGVIRGVKAVYRAAPELGFLLDEPMPLVTSTWDSVELLTPLQNGDAVDLDEYAVFLPWSPFEGHHDYGAALTGGLVTDNSGKLVLRIADPVSKGLVAGRSIILGDMQHDTPVVMSGANTVTYAITVATNILDSGLLVGDVIMFGDSGGLPTGLTAGIQYTVVQVDDDRTFYVALLMFSPIVQPTSLGIAGLWDFTRLSPRTFRGGFLAGERVYVASVEGDDLELSQTRGGAVLTHTATSGGETVLVYALHADHVDRGSPYPPGFNYPTSQVVPTDGQPYDGFSPTSRAKIGLATPLAYRFSIALGEPIYVVNVGVPDSSVGARAIAPAADGDGFAWFDPAANVAWSPGQASCFKTLTDFLDLAVRAFRAQGDTGECIAVVHAGGDVDTLYPELVRTFEESFVTLRDSIREELSARVLITGDAASLPFLVVELVEDGAEARATVNAAFASTLDARSRVVAVNDLVDVLTGEGLEPDDGSAPLPPIGGI